MASVKLRPLPERITSSASTANLVLNALSAPVFLVDGADRLHLVNNAAEQFFRASAASLIGRSLLDFLAADSPLLALISQVRATGVGTSEYDVSLDGPRFGAHLVSIDVVPLVEMDGCLTVALHPRSIADKIDRQLNHRGAARSVMGMASLLAHELKNPLSGIRGAAQLLERDASAGDAELAHLICEEADRIVALIDRMEMFTGDRPIERNAVNIHRILEHTRRVAESGFAAGCRFVELYDPSLPPVLGNRDLLIQLFMNLMKNAAEATTAGEGVITLTTRYQHGVRVAAPAGGDTRLQLPLVVTVEDNGSGIPEDLRPHLFDPFVTTKIGGKGLGLALVAKIVGDHGGVIEFDSQSRRTVFKVMLPAAASLAEDES
ncbi:MAG TPA: ATP-binding protein [Candidatus Angelobacter sp.]|nr:ATP-binding protein [Candidatus Angelobacter sp.]